MTLDRAGLDLDSMSPAILAGFEAASPALLESRSLQRRVDRKFLLPVTVLDEVLERLREDHRVVQSSGELAAHYSTQYFDTPDLAMFNDHRRGRRPRYKVRIRQHLNRKLSFLEIKRKGNNDRTSKARLTIPFGQTWLDAACRTFLTEHCPFDPHLLVAGPLVLFRRVTLFSVSTEERITLDWVLDVRSEGRHEVLPDVLFAEVKQGRFSNHSSAMATFRQLHIRERAVSKYCLAVIKLTGKTSGTFKPALRVVERLSA